MNHAIDTGFWVAAEVEDHADHAGANAIFAQLTAAGDRFALTPQVIAEFVHVVTDARRFPSPLTLDEAIDIAERWWTARETIRLAPADAAVRDFLQWMRAFRLGRKRVLDTMLAATLRRSGIKSILTTNAHDFQIFSEFSMISP